MANDAPLLTLTELHRRQSAELFAKTLAIVDEAMAHIRRRGSVSAETQAQIADIEAKRAALIELYTREQAELDVKLADLKRRMEDT